MRTKLSILAAIICLAVTSCTKERSPSELAQIWMKDYLKSHPEFQPRSIIPGSNGPIPEGSAGSLVTVVSKTDKTQERTFQLLYVKEGNIWKFSQATEIQE